jgi:hypothetical protein
MHSNASSGYKAPPRVLAHFNLTRSVTREFPSCVDPENENLEGPDINVDRVKNTLFVCDRGVGKRVGNDNDVATCGGTFGMWVPMHFTSTLIDEKKYNNAVDFNKNISLIDSN